MPTQHTIDRETFLARLKESGLLTMDQFQQAYDVAAQSVKGKALARALVERGLLTAFQAELILRGKTDGFQLGQYRILDQIGRGGMGRVFKAEHLTMNRVVALKVLSTRHSRTDRARQLFHREVRAAARLVHPNIVTAYDANEVNDRLYLVMEYVDGPNLQELVRQRGPLPVGQACEVIRQAALGLQCAHELGMVHRDIKPANLLIQRGSGGCVVKILDFGLARLHEPSEEFKPDESIPAGESAVMGTPDFLSPEQARNLHSVDIRSDLYSLGCTFFYLLTGQVPFPGGTALEKLVRHASEDIIPVDQLRGDVPHDVSAAVGKLLAKKPADRFQTPSELAAVLAPFATTSSGVYRALGAPTSGSEAPSTADSPWADLMSDDGSLLGTTMPVNLGTTQVSPGKKRAKQPDEPDTSQRPWPILGIVVGALALGFALGVTALAVALLR
jgi:serine/threonine-protein kinase